MISHRKDITNDSDIKKTPPPHGWINNIAKIVGCSRLTVHNAIFKCTKGEKANKCREVFNELYGD